MKHKLLISVMALTLAISQPANAHDELISQSPTQGQTVSAGVVEIRLEINSAPLTLDDGSGNEISVTGPNGAVKYAGCLPIAGNLGVLSADLDQVGTHKVAWRMVSSDGHPISGEFSFEVENNSGYVSNPEFIYPDCGNGLISPNEQPADLYWLLWLALSVFAATVFFFLRPKKKI